MKRRLLNLLTLVSVMLIAGVSSAWAQGSSSFDLATFDAAHPVIFTQDNVTLQFNKSSDISPDSKGRGIRWQTSIDFTITVPEGNHVTEVLLTSNSNGNFNVDQDKVMPIVISAANADGTKGEYIEDWTTISAKAATYTWTNTNEITNNSINFSFDGAGDAYIISIDVKYDANSQTGGEEEKDFVAENIAAMKTQPSGTEVKLMLNDAKVTVVEQGFIGQIVIIEDATAAVQVATSNSFGDLEDEKSGLGNIFSKVGQTVNGYIYCTYMNESAMRCICDNEKTAESQTEISDGEAPVPTEATIAQISDMAYDMRYVKVSDAKIEIDMEEQKIYLVQGEDKISIFDMFQKFTTPDINIESITGVMMPIPNEDDDNTMYTFIPLTFVEAVAPSYVEVANIAGLKDIENGTEVKLTLTNAKVTVVEQGIMGQTVIIEDESGAIMVQAEGWDDDYLGNLFTTVGQVANGYVICTYVNAYGTKAIADSEHSTESEVTLNDELAVVTPGVVFASALNSTANEMKYLRVYNAKIAIDPEEDPYLSQGNSKIMISPMAMGLIYANAEIDDDGNPIIPEIYNYVDGYSVLIGSEEGENGTVVNTFMFNPTAIVPANFKEYTETTVFLPTDESIATANAEAWVASTGAMVTNKKGNIDPATGESISAKAIPGIYTKGNNVGKQFVTYATGVSEITAYVISTGSSERTMYATATPVGEGETVVASASTPQNETVLVTLAGLDPTKQYVVEYSSWEGAAPENNAKPTTSGSDMAITGVKFVVTTGDVPDAITEISSEVNFINAPVYSVNGVKVRNAGESLEGLAKGLYIIGGKKVVVK